MTLPLFLVPSRYVLRKLQRDICMWPGILAWELYK